MSHVFFTVVRKPVGTIVTTRHNLPSACNITVVKMSRGPDLLD